MTAEAAARPRTTHQAARRPAGPAGGERAAWARCDSCGALVYRKRLARNLQVCPECGFHHRLSAPQRIEQLTDPGTFTALPACAEALDRLEFTDTVPYPARLARAREATGLDEAVVCGMAKLSGRPLFLAVMDFRFMGGSLSAAVGERIAQTADLARARKLPLLIVTASGGARMQEGCLSLMQMAATSEAIARRREAGLLTISLITDPTYGGVAASFATNADVIIAEAGARMGFAGPRVIKQTIRQDLPAGFQTAEFLLRHGQVDMVEARQGLRPVIHRLLAAAGQAPAAAAPALAGGDKAAGPAVITDPEALPARDPWQTVQAARDIGRPTARDYLAAAFDSFTELHGDRMYGDCPSIVAGLARIGDLPVAVVGHQKGHSTAELVARNFGMPRPEGYRKALRVMTLAARLGIPVVTLVDTPGAYPGVDAEERGQARAIADSILQMSRLPVPIVTVVTGEGGSGGALALAVADDVLILQDGVYSVISPEGCSSILWNTPTRAADAARSLHLDAPRLLRLGVVDGVIPEPGGGAAADHAGTAAAVRQAVAASLARLLRVPTGMLLAQRRARFRQHGRPPAAPPAQAPAGAASDDRTGGSRADVW